MFYANSQWCASLVKKGPKTVPTVALGGFALLSISTREETPRVSERRIISVSGCHCYPAESQLLDSDIPERRSLDLCPMAVRKLIAVLGSFKE
jgi:hypothetical protein